MEFVLVFLRQCCRSNVLHQSDDEIAGTDKRINDMHAGIR